MEKIGRRFSAMSLVEDAQAFLESKCGRPVSEDEAKQCIDTLLSYSRVLLEIDADLRAKATKDKEVAR